MSTSHSPPEGSLIVDASARLSPDGRTASSAGLTRTTTSDAPIEQQQRRHHVFRARWKSAITKISQTPSLYSSVQRVPFELGRIGEFRTLFIDDLGLYEKELTLEEFQKAFSQALAGRNFSAEELESWFSDIDVDCGSTVSWDEFSQFSLNSSRIEADLQRDMDRARDFTLDVTSPITNPGLLCHRNQINCILTLGNPKFLGQPDPKHVADTGMLSILTSDSAGVVKLWNKGRTLEEAVSLAAGQRGQPAVAPTLTSSVENITTGATKTAGSHGFVHATPIVDMTVSGGGNDATFFCLGANRSVNVFSARTKKVVQRFMGFPRAASQFIRSSLGSGERGSAFGADASDGVPLVRLLDMDDFPASIAVSRPTDYARRDATLEELFFFGMQSGSIAVYKTERHTIRALREPLRIHNHLHTDRVHKISYEPHFGGLVSASWDATMRIFDPVSERVRFSFDGVNRHFIAFGEAPIQSTIATCGFGAGADDVDPADLRHQTQVLDFATSPQDNLIATAAASPDVLLWSPAQSTHPIGLLRLPKSKAIAVTFCPDSQLCCTLDQVGVIRVWDLRSNRNCVRQTIHVEEHDGSPPEAYQDRPSGRHLSYSARTGVLVCGNRTPTTWTMRKKIAACIVSNDRPIDSLLLDSASGGGWIITTDSAEVSAFSIKRGTRKLMFCPMSGADESSTSSSSSSGGAKAKKGGEKSSEDADNNATAAAAAAAAASAASASGNNTNSSSSSSSGGKHPIVAMAIDHHERRGFFVSRCGLIRVYNIRTGLLLSQLRPRHFKDNGESGDIFALCALASQDASQRVIAVATSSELHTMWDSSMNDTLTKGTASFAHKKHRVFRCADHGVPRVCQVARGMHPDDRTFLPPLLFAVEDGRIFCMNAASGVVFSTLRGGLSLRGLAPPAVPLRGDATVGRTAAAAHSVSLFKKDKKAGDGNDIVHPNSDNEHGGGEENEDEQLRRKRDVAGRGAVAALLATVGQNPGRMPAIMMAPKKGSSAATITTTTTTTTTTTVDRHGTAAVKQPSDLANPRIEDWTIVRKKDLLILCFDSSMLIEFWNLRFNDFVLARNVWPTLHLHPENKDNNNSNNNKTGFTALATDGRGEMLFIGDVNGNILVADIRALDPKVADQSGCHWMQPSKPQQHQQQRKKSDGSIQNNSTELPSSLLIASSALSPNNSNNMPSQQQQQQQQRSSSLDDPVRLLKVFRAHSEGAVLRLHFSDAQARLISQGAGDLAVQCHTALGKHVGFFGPAEPFGSSTERGGPPSDPLVRAATLTPQERQQVPVIAAHDAFPFKQQRTEAKKCAQDDDLQRKREAKKATAADFFTTELPSLDDLSDDEVDDVATRQKKKRESAAAAAADSVKKSDPLIQEPGLPLVRVPPSRIHNRPLPVFPQGFGQYEALSLARRALTPSPVVGMAASAHHQHLLPPIQHQHRSQSRSHNQPSASHHHFKFASSPLADLRKRIEIEHEQLEQLPVPLRTHNGLQRHLREGKAAAAALATSSSTTAPSATASLSGGGVSRSEANRIPIEELSYWKEERNMNKSLGQRSRMHTK